MSSQISELIYSKPKNKFPKNLWNFCWVYYIQIIRTFVQLRNLIESNADLLLRLDDLEKRYEGQFKIIFKAIRQIMIEPTITRKTPIGFRRDNN